MELKRDVKKAVVNAVGSVAYANAELEAQREFRGSYIFIIITTITIIAINK